MMMLNKNKSGSMLLRSIQDLVFLVIIVFLIVFSSFSSQAQIKDIFKYSTFYASGNIGAPLTLTSSFTLTELLGLVN